jgi:NAD(P)-dependent dehydrogenase (short-subunit alcohol dehydrogenase family)
MIARRTPGSLVNVASISALASAPFHGPYGAAKSGITALTRTMAFEWGRHGIRANSVAPGACWTQRVATMSEQNTGPSMDGANELPDLVWVSADELACVIMFLMSDLASGVSGQNIVVDSGLTTKFAGGGQKLGNPKPLPRIFGRDL